MIKIIKIGDLVYQNIEPYSTDENGNKHWNIPNTPDTLKFAIEDTLAWLTSQKIQNAIGGQNKVNTSASKSVVLLAKLINTLNPDTTKLTDNEKAIYNDMLTLADNGYSDSNLLKQSFDAIKDALINYTNQLKEIEGLTTIDDMIKFLENLS